MDDNKKIKYDSAYISYVENGDSAAVFIIRDIVTAIDTSGMWIDIIYSPGHKNKNKENRWDFSSIMAELFPRKTSPIYPLDASDEIKKYITWQTAQKDITKWRSSGYIGKKYVIKLKLININQGKTRTVERLYNKRFKTYVPWEWRTSSCEVRKKKIPQKPKWEYKILSVNPI